MWRETEAILGQSQDRLQWPEVCAACGTATRGREGEMIPLCAAHLGNLLLLAAIFDEADELRRVLEVVTA